MMNIFVGNLGPDITERALFKIFSEYGDIKKVSVIIDQYTGMSRGFGFVEMDSESEGMNAIKVLNNQVFMGRRIFVNKRER